MYLSLFIIKETLMFFITMVPLDVIYISLEVNFRIFITADRTSWYTTVVGTPL